MNNLLRAENAAIKEIETALIESGWSDGWELTDEDVRAAANPLFYRNSTSTAASEARVKAKGQTHSLYCIYNVIETKSNYAGDKPVHFDVTIALTFYYDDPFLFQEDDKNEFIPYIEGLLDALADDLWTISGEGESSVPSTDDARVYSNRKVLFVTNNF